MLYSGFVFRVSAQISKIFSMCDRWSLDRFADCEYIGTIETEAAMTVYRDYIIKRKHRGYCVETADGERLFRLLASAKAFIDNRIAQS